LPWSPLLDHLLLGLVLNLGELDVLMMMPFSQVDVVAVERPIRQPERGE
jgi:hypothetical protein